MPPCRVGEWLRRRKHIRRIIIRIMVNNSMTVRAANPGSDGHTISLNGTMARTIDRTKLTVQDPMSLRPVLLERVPVTIKLLLGK